MREESTNIECPCGAKDCKPNRVWSFANIGTFASCKRIDRTYLKQDGKEGWSIFEGFNPTDHVWHEGNVLTFVGKTDSATLWFKDESGQMYIKAGTIYVKVDGQKFENSAWKHVEDYYSDKAKHKLANMMAHKYLIVSIGNNVIVERKGEKYLIEPDGNIYKLEPRI